MHSCGALSSVKRLLVIVMAIGLCYLPYSSSSQSSKHNEQLTLAYHVLHPDENMYFLLRILSEVLYYPLNTHVFIHTHTHIRLALPDEFGRNNITIVRHDIDEEVHKEHHVGFDPALSKHHHHGGKTKSEIRGDMLAVTSSLREQILLLGERFDFTMYSENDIFVRRQTIDMFLGRYKKASEMNSQVGFVRVECTRTVCRTVDLKKPVRPRGIHFDAEHRNHAQENATHSGVWIYGKVQFKWLVDNHNSFLRYPNHDLGRRESIGIGGAHAFKYTFYPLTGASAGLPGTPAPIPEGMVLHYGTNSWHLGVWWCRIMPNLPKCSHPPEEFFPPSSDNSTMNMVIPQENPPLNATKMAAALAPLAVKLCPAADIQFNRSKMHYIATPHMFIPQPHHLRVGYAPWITKGGSTTAISMLKELTGLSTGAEEELTDELLSNYSYISFIRNPVERALAGYHQLEIFYHMGWLDRTVSMYGVSFWNQHCLNTTYGKPTKRSLNCTGSAPDSSMQTVLRRIIGYFEEIDRIGFYDQHQTPMSYLIASSSIIVSPRLYFFDMKTMFDVDEILSNVTGRKWNRLVKMKRAPDDRKDTPWSLTWKELAALRSGSESNIIELASKAVDLVCRLYKSDIDCLPYDIPECP